MDSETINNRLLKSQHSESQSVRSSRQRVGQFWDQTSDEYYSLENLIKRGRQSKITPVQPLTKEQQSKLESLSEALKACFKLRKVIEDHQFGYFFKYPVDPYKLGLTDYWRVIQRPIDLTTIKQKFLMGLYVKASQFNQDMCLLFNNALTYNSTNQEILIKTKELFTIYQTNYSEIETLISQNRLSQRFQEAHSSSSLVSKLNTAQVVSIFNQTRLQKLGRLLSFLNNRKKRSLLASLKKKYNDLPIVEGQNQRVYFNKLSANQIYDLLKLAKNTSSIDFDMAKLMNIRRNSPVDAQNLDNSQNRAQEQVESEFQIQDEEDE